MSIRKRTRMASYTKALGPRMTGPAMAALLHAAAQGQGRQAAPDLLARPDPHGRA